MEIFRNIGKTLATLVLTGSLLFNVGCSENSQKKEISANRPFRQHAEYVDNSGTTDYALICDGNDDNNNGVRNISAIKILLERNGFKPENIYILSNKQGTDRTPYGADGSFTKENLDSAFSYIGRKITQKNHFFVYVNGHMTAADRFGERKAQILLPREKIMAEDLGEKLAKMNFGMGTIILDGCHSEDIAFESMRAYDKNANKYPSELNLNAIYSCAADEKTANDSPTNGFGYNFVLAALDTDRNDFNKDGIHSIKETLDYAACLKNKSNREQPARWGPLSDGPTVEHPGFIGWEYEKRNLFEIPRIGARWTQSSLNR